MMVQVSSPSPQVLTPARRAEAARYALLRRLAPSMRHHLVVNLQPIGMIYEVMSRRLKAAQPDLSNVQASAQKINGLARAALDSCLDVVTWLAPEEGACTTAAEGARECVALIATSLSFHGYGVRNEVETVAGEVRRAALRNVLTAALIQITDDLPAPAELHLCAQPTAGGLRVELTLRPVEGDAAAGDTQPSYRHLDSADLDALAASEQVELVRPGPGRIVLTFAWVQPPRA